MCNVTPVVGVGVLIGPFLPNVHSVSSLSVPISASVASFPSVPHAVGGNLSFGE